MSELAQGFSGSRSINGSQETSCIERKGFLMFLSYSTLLPQKYTDEDLSCGVLPSRQILGGRLSISEGVAPGYSW